MVTKILGPSEEKMDDFFAVRKRLMKVNIAYQFQVMTIGMQLTQLAGTHISKLISLRPTSPLISRIGKDLQCWQKAATFAGSEIMGCLKSANDMLPYAIYLLWHVLDEAEKSHETRYHQDLAKKHSPSEFKSLLAIPRDIYSFKTALESIPAIALYVQRLNKFILKNKRTIAFKGQWEITVDNPQENIEITNDSTDIGAACHDYLEFLNNMLRDKLNQMDIFAEILEKFLLV